jgi:four helix bundle protein
MQLIAESDRLCSRLQAAKRFALADQLFRAASSVAANIAEGQGRLAKGDNVRHLGIARGSLFELETHLSTAELIGVLAAAELHVAFGLADEVGRMLTTLIRRLGTRRLDSGNSQSLVTNH